MARWLMRGFVALSALVCAAGLGYVYVAPPEGLRLTRDGAPHLAPAVIHPLTGEAVPLERLIRHYKGQQP